MQTHPSPKRPDKPIELDYDGQVLSEMRRLDPIGVQRSREQRAATRQELAERVREVMAESEADTEVMA